MLNKLSETYPFPSRYGWRSFRCETNVSLLVKGGPVYWGWTLTTTLYRSSRKPYIESHTGSDHPDVYAKTSGSQPPADPTSWQGPSQRKGQCIAVKIFTGSIPRQGLFVHALAGGVYETKHTRFFKLLLSRFAEAFTTLLICSLSPCLNF